MAPWFLAGPPVGGPRSSIVPHGWHHRHHHSGGINAVLLQAELSQCIWKRMTLSCEATIEDGEGQQGTTVKAAPGKPGPAVAPGPTQTDEAKLSAMSGQYGTPLVFKVLYRHMFAHWGAGQAKGWTL
ncbi:unnamed protein product [Gadus morhua 'NCC']